MNLKNIFSILFVILFFSCEINETAINSNNLLLGSWIKPKYDSETTTYKISDNKFKTHLIGGFSTLFLKENQIRLSTSSFSKEGKANNLNNINFSGNLGVDFNYNLNTNWSLHINPMFKTQLNTFNKNPDRFQPYTIGIYTGIHYQF